MGDPREAVDAADRIARQHAAVVTLGDAVQAYFEAVLPVSYFTAPGGAAVLTVTPGEFLAAAERLLRARNEAVKTILGDHDGD